MSNFLLAPSVLSADFGHFAGAVKFIEEHHGDWVHFDVMDGNFVPDITFGHKVVADVRHLSKKIFDVHLMTSHPQQHVASFAAAGADYITFHVESTVHAHRVVQQIHDAGCRAGISIVPSTPVCAVEQLLPFVDLVLVMTVNPGYGGQAMIPNALSKVTALRRLREAGNFRFLISIDGGFCEATIPDVVKTAPDVVVTGSMFFMQTERLFKLLPR